MSISVNTGSALGDLVGGMLATALTKEIIVGRRCNDHILSDMPAGKYHGYFDLDMDQLSAPKEFDVRLSNSY